MTCRRGRRGPVAVTTAVALLLAAGPAGADDVAADDGDAAGARLAAAGDHRGALVAYQRAAIAAPSAARLCALGLAHDRLDDAARAHAFLEACLAAGATGAAAADATRARARRRKELDASDHGVLVVSSKPPGARVTLAFLAPGPALAAPLTVYLPPGEHEVAAEAPGHQPYRRAVEITARMRQSIRAELTPLAGPAVNDVDFEDEGPAPGSMVTSPDQRPRKHKSLLRDRYQGPDGAAPAGAGLADPMPTRTARAPLAFLALGGGAVLVGAGVGFTIAARSAAHDRDALPPGDERAGRDDAARTRRTVAIACYAAGAATAGLGVYLLVRAPRARLAATPTGDGRGAALWLSGAW